MTVVLMFAVIAAAAVGLVYPQVSRVGAREVAAWQAAHPVLAGIGRPLGAHNVFASWWFLIGAALLFINGALCSIEQVQRALRLGRSRGFAVSARMVRTDRRNLIASSARSSERLVAVVRETLGRSHVHVREGTSEGAPALLGVSRGWSQWGTVAFHVGLLLVLVSAVLVSLTEAEGSFRVAVGGGFTDGPEAYGRYARGPWGPDSLGGWSLSLTSFDPRHARGDFIPGPASTVVVTASDGSRHERRDLTRGEYFEVGRTDIFQSPGWGFAPVLEIRDPAGQVRTGSVIMRRELEGKRPPTARFDVAGELSGTAQPLQLTQSTDVKPRLRVRLFRGKKRIFTGVVDYGATVERGGYAVTYKDYIYWSEFFAVANPWLPALNAGFWSLVMSLTIMYVWPATYVWAVVRAEDGGHAVFMGGRRDKYSRSLGELVEKVKDAIAAAEKGQG